MVAGADAAEEGVEEPNRGVLLVLAGAAETPAEALLPKLNPPEAPAAGALPAAAGVLAAAGAAAGPNENPDGAEDAGAAASKTSPQATTWTCQA